MSKEITMQNYKNNRFHHFAGILSTISALFFAGLFVYLNSEADNTESQVTVGNSPPTIMGMTISTSSDEYPLPLNSFQPNENNTTTLYISGDIDDLNGCADVETDGDIQAQFYRSGLVTTTCDAVGETDPRSCYALTTTTHPTLGAPAFCVFSGCTPPGIIDTDLHFQCTFPSYHFIDGTDAGSIYPTENWRIQGIVTDSSGASSYHSAGLSSEVETLGAISVPTTLNYGTVSSGDTSSEQTLAITNTGNKSTVGAQVMSSAAMNCSIAGTITIGSQRFASSTSNYYAKTVLTSGVQSISGVNVAKQTAIGVPSSANSYWQIQLPGDGIAGTCTGTLNFYAN